MNERATKTKKNKVSFCDIFGKYDSDDAYKSYMHESNIEEEVENDPRVYESET